jgi:hypothetical protein
MLSAEKSTTGRGIRTYFLSALIISAIMFVGFAKNYYLRTWIGTRPITAIVHVHGLVMTAWILLFLTQTLLVARRRTIYTANWVSAVRYSQSSWWRLAFTSTPFGIGVCIRRYFGAALW